MTQLLSKEFLDKFPAKNSVQIDKDILADQINKNLTNAIKHFQDIGYPYKADKMTMEAEVLFENVFNEKQRLPQEEFITHDIDRIMVSNLEENGFEHLKQSAKQKTTILINNEKLQEKVPYKASLSLFTGSISAEWGDTPYATVDVSQFVETTEDGKEIDYSGFMQALALSVRACMRENVHVKVKSNKTIVRDNTVLVALSKWKKAIKELDYSVAHEEQLLRIAQDTVNTESLRYSLTLRVPPPLLTTGNIIEALDNDDVVEQLETYMRFKTFYANHNPQFIVQVKEDEWSAVEEWLHENWNNIIAIAFREVE